MRYIERNPVRAAMVDDPAHYRRSSYRANAHFPAKIETVAGERPRLHEAGQGLLDV